MFSQVSLRNFRVYDDITVNLKNRRGSVKSRAYLFGENTTGKTSFLLSFAFLKSLALGYRINEVFRNRKNILPELVVKPFDMKAEASKHYRYNATGSMILTYDINIRNVIYQYMLEFDAVGNLVQESLSKTTNKQESLVFKSDASGIVFGRNTLQPRDRTKVKYACDKHFGSYTALSILDYLHYEYPEYEFKSTLTAFIEYISNLKIFIEDHFNQNDYINFFANSVSFVTNGHADRALLNILLISEPLLNEVACSVFPNIKKVFYKYKEIEPGKYEYRMMTLTQTKAGTIETASTELSTSVRKIMYLNVYFFDLLMGATVVYDNFDTNIHQGPLLFMIQHLLPRLSGQFITSIDSLDTFNHLEASSLYIARIEDLHYSVSSLDSIATIQTNHNLRKRYECGHFGKTHLAKVPSLHLYYEHYLKEIKNLKK